MLLAIVIISPKITIKNILMLTQSFILKNSCFLIGGLENIYCG